AAANAAADRRTAAAQGFAGPRGAIEWHARELRLAGGQAEWLQQTATLAADKDDAAGDQPAAGPAANDSPRQRRAAAARLAHAALAAIAEELHAWAQPAAPLAWHDRLLGLLRRLRYGVAESGTPPAGGDPIPRVGPGDAERDAAALTAIGDAFASLERLAEWRRTDPPSLNAERVAALVGEWRRTLKLDVPNPTEGCVRLVSVEAARELRPRRLYLVGMSEQAFPAPARASMVDAAAAGVAGHSSREMLLFLQLVLAPAESVTFSYAARDDAGQPLSPSSYVAEVQRLLARASLEVEATPGAAVSPRAARTTAVRELNSGNARLLPRVAAADSPLAAGLRVALDRAGGDTFGPAEGITPGAAPWLAERYGPRHLWSPTQLETYAACPFTFFMRHVLGLAPAPGLEFEIDYRRRGSLLHNAMVHLHAGLNGGGGNGGATPLSELAKMPDAEFLQEFDAAIDAARRAMRAPSQQAAVLDIEAMQTRGWGADYHTQLGKYAKAEHTLAGAMRAEHFEVRFGPPRDPGEVLTPPSTPEPFAMPIDGEVILLTGQIDRIDRGEKDGQPVFNVVDYKTAAKQTAPVDQLEDGRQLQLYLYTLATQQHVLRGEGAAPWRLGYWALRDGGFKPPKRGNQAVAPSKLADDGLQPTEDWAKFGDAVRQRLGQIVRGIRGGEFPAISPDENYVDRGEFRTISRMGQARSLQKLAPSDPALAALRASKKPAASTPTSGGAP
ncbi:MAG: PD-(D/E)XK nuclease family protein, partial [Planctomycetota bacterium]